MGSDFSYNDLSKANDILTKYTHRLIDTGQDDTHAVYTIEAMPKPGAPVVWGKQVVKVRDDGVMMGETSGGNRIEPHLDYAGGYDHGLLARPSARRLWRGRDRRRSRK
ncbi:MAG: hypothetical protein CVT83_00045 [Alphaproteobacteria bacterium HGW-Alphaproteobacteria-5]|nr:MAG: hypothetical protein CVT83_00045 [Alphaproteobacteria bacterium HGW-Alphaproteobacteria-5]